ncbi:beta-1,3-galactosyltransferase 5-like [Saccostrea echinata]|uniref:beta-1,3-galactosyltransferase 5-like n=1 Tax=Saccostrea echinata TaxID=191078 RepID=UPI002A836F0D|nr:beta-1,3-galactosyltransferase 5-like [Saccostrea echinata]
MSVIHPKPPQKTEGSSVIMAKYLRPFITTETMTVLLAAVSLVYVIYMCETLNRLDKVKTKAMKNRYVVIDVDNPFALIVDDAQDTSISIQEKQFNTLGTPSTACKSDRVRNVIIIVTSPLEVHARSVVRHSWVSDLLKKDAIIGYFFLVGSENRNWNPEHQASHYNDILNFNVNYNTHNTTELLLLGLKWVIQNCQSVKHITKVHGDIFVNTLKFSRLAYFLPDSKFIGGQCFGTSKPNRNKVSPFYVTFQEYKKELYPPMCSTSAYIMSSDLVQNILHAVGEVPHFRLEDVFIGQVLSHLRITPRNIVNFVTDELNAANCDVIRDVLLVHEADIDHMYRLWRQIKQCYSNVTKSDEALIVKFSELKNYSHTILREH